MTQPVLWVVGGFLRDYFLGVKGKDVDFTVEVPDINSLVDYLNNKFSKVLISQIDDEYGRIIAGVPSNELHWTKHAYSRMYGDVPKILYADFVISRSDGDYTDGRHTTVVPANIEADLNRRDFTVNAIAINDATGVILDPHNGLTHIKNKVLKTVDHPKISFTQDVLRVLRFYRLLLTKELEADAFALKTIYSEADYFAKVLSEPIFRDRIHIELGKMFRHNSWATMNMLTNKVPNSILDTIFEKQGLWLKPSYEQRKFSKVR